MPGRIHSEFVFPSLPAYRSLSRRRRIVFELSLGLVVLAFVGLGASVQMPGWIRLIGWALLVGYWMAWSVLAFRHWLRRRGWQK